MKLLCGVVSYLAVVGAVIAAAYAGISSIERSQPQESVVLAQGTDDSTALRARAREEAKVDPNRIPVWIAPTAKYEYTPVPVVSRPKHNAFIGKDARGAMAKSRHSIDGRKGIDDALRDKSLAGPSLGFAPRSRDNDPFFRD